MQSISNPIELARLILANAPEELIDGRFKPAAWLEAGNIALRVGNDLAMFEDLGDGVYLAHVWFASRGKEAIEAARSILEEMFARGATAICGETPASRRDALLFVRKLGFRPRGEAMRPQGRVIVSVLYGNTQAARSVA